jgi:hypothetical protein
VEVYVYSPNTPSWRDDQLKHRDNFMDLIKHHIKKKVFHIKAAALKVKVKLFLCITKYYTMKTYGGVEVKLYDFLSSALDVENW